MNEETGSPGEGPARAPTAGMSGFKKVRLIVAWAAGLYLMTLFVRNGWRKFDPEGFWSGPFERWGYPVWLRILVGIIETGGGLGILIPWIATYSGIGLFVVMVGAFYTRWGAGFPADLVWIAIYGLVSLWIAFEWKDFALFRRR